MAYYLVKAQLNWDSAEELHQKLKDGEFHELRPFGRELNRALLEARRHPETGKAIWEEEDYCTPPLAQEREAVLDHYFSDLEVERVEEDEGWRKIENFPSLWKDV